MPVRFFYVDESYDTRKYVLSALVIRHSDWKECFDMVREHRANLKKDFGILLRREIHARDLIKGRGRISPTPISKWERSRIFFNLLKLIASLPQVQLFNVCLDVSAHRDPQMVAWDRLMNRAERAMLGLEQTELPLRRGLIGRATGNVSADDVREIERRLNIYRSRAMILADEGREIEITRALRKMHVFNPVPSLMGGWSTGTYTRNITTDRMIEDPVFKDSQRSYFIQMADCVAFALLKKEVPPTPLVKKYGIHEMFDKTLAGICFGKASRSDRLGIVRH